MTIGYLRTSNQIFQIIGDRDVNLPLSWRCGHSSLCLCHSGFMLDNNIRLNIVENGTVAVFGWSLTNFRSIMKRTFEDTQLSFFGLRFRG